MPVTIETINLVGNRQKILFYRDIVYATARSQDLSPATYSIRRYSDYPDKEEGSLMKELPEWYYNEFQQIGTDYSDREEILKYDRKMGTIRNIAREAETMIKLIDIQPEHSILEIGCGTGEFSIELSKYCAQVLALDISQGMLDFAMDKAKVRGRNNVDFEKAGFLTFDPDERIFDTVISQLVLHHLPDFWKLIALKNINSMLKDGGKFYLKDVVYSSDTPDFDPFFSQTLQNLPPGAGDDMRYDIILHIKKEFSTFDWIMEELIEKAGFRIEEAIYKNGFMATYLCIKV